MWTQRLARTFSKVIESAGLKSYRASTLPKLFIDKPNILEAFNEFSKHRQEGLGPYVKAACENKICPLCKHHFLSGKSYTESGKLLWRWASSCVKCLETKEGRKLSNKTREGTCVKIYKVKNVSASNEIKLKKEQSNLKNLGVRNPSQSYQVKSKKVKTSRKNYGVDNPMQSQKVINKMIKNCMKKNGVRHVSQLAEVRQKQRRNRLWVVTTKRKDYLVEGYERFIIPTLEAKYDNVLCQFDSNFPEIKLDSTIYNPDFFIPQTATYIEIRSAYTLYGLKNYWKESIKLHRQCDSLDYKVKVCIVFAKNGKSFPIKYMLLPRNWYKMTIENLEQYCKVKNKHSGIEPKHGAYFSDKLTPKEN